MTIEELKQYIKNKYEKMEWRGFYDGSMGEAVSDGEDIGTINTLYEIGSLLGLDLPEFDEYEESIEDGEKIWNGKDGLIDNPDD